MTRNARGQSALIRAGGELAAYTDEDLLTVNFRVVWTKPVRCRFLQGPDTGTGRVAVGYAAWLTKRSSGRD